jgi:polysaccharide deacetylase family protein (PEP-CTERM system associated)
MVSCILYFRGVAMEKIVFKGNIPSLFTIDVEDYYHFFENRGAPPLSEWDSLPARVENNFRKLLEMLAKREIKATCFFLGYIAKRFPNLVKDASNLGHDIASHGMYHKLIFSMSSQEFYQDALDSRNLLENISGNSVEGFRSPSFSLNVNTPWFFEKLSEAGYIFDSSLFPVRRENGGLVCSKFEPHWIQTESGKICEFPISVAPFMGKQICFFGGGYLRLFPLSLIKSMGKRVNKSGRPVIYYIHPREIDPDHPRIKMSRLHAFKSYVNLNTVQAKLDSILQNNEFITCREYKNTIMKERQ